MKKKAAIFMAAFYLLLITGGYACIISCGSNHLMELMASNDSSKGHSHNGKDKRSEAKSDLIKIQEHDQNLMMGIMHAMMAKMTVMPMSKDPDDDFAMMMKMHHQGAIDMSNAELKDGDDAQMKEMAQKIIAAQQAEIVQLDAFLAVHNPHMMSMEFNEQMMKEMGKNEKQADLQIINGDIDHDFAMLMIGHHHAAIENSRLELIYGHDASMKAMAQKIIDAQQAEIKELQEWLLSDGK